MWGDRKESHFNPKCKGEPMSFGAVATTGIMVVSFCDWKPGEATREFLEQLQVEKKEREENFEKFKSLETEFRMAFFFKTIRTSTLEHFRDVIDSILKESQ